MCEHPNGLPGLRGGISAKFKEFIGLAREFRGFDNSFGRSTHRWEGRAGGARFFRADRVTPRA